MKEPSGTWIKSRGSRRVSSGTLLASDLEPWTIHTHNPPFEVLTSKLNSVRHREPSLLEGVATLTPRRFCFVSTYRSEVLVEGRCVVQCIGYRMQAMLKTRISTMILALVLFVGTVVTAQGPARNVSGARHPNLAAAQRLSHQAYEKIIAAQQANEWDMQGHAQKAKDLLDQANNELKLAAGSANRK